MLVNALEFNHLLFEVESEEPSQKIWIPRLDAKSDTKLGGFKPTEPSDYWSAELTQRCKWELKEAFAPQEYSAARATHCALALAQNIP